MSKFGLLFLLVFLGGLYGIVFVAPVYGFYLYELIYFLNPSKRWWGNGIPSVSYSFVTVLFTLAIYFIKRKEFQQNTIKKAPEFKWMLLLLGVYLLLSPIAIAPTLHSRFVFDLFKLFLIMFVAFRLIDTQKKLEIALFCYLVGCAYIGYEAFNVGRNETGRVEGIGTLDAPDSNGISAAIAPAIPLFMYYMWRAKTKTKMLLGLCAVLTLNGIVLLNSRGAFLGVVAGTGYFLIIMTFSKYKLKKQRLMLLSIVLVGVLGLARFTDDAFWARMSTITESSVENQDESGARRVLFWLSTFDMLDDYPLGVGIWGYQTLSSFYLSEEQMADARREGHTGRAVHSIWFQGLSEVGWVGFTFFVLLLLSTKRHTGKAKKEAVKHEDYECYYLIVALEASVISFLAAASFIDAFRAETLYWLIMFCASASVISLNKYESLNAAKDKLAESKK